MEAAPLLFVRCCYSINRFRDSFTGIIRRGVSDEHRPTTAFKTGGTKAARDRGRMLKA